VVETRARAGEALAQLRRACGVSQAELAARLDTTQSAIARLEGDRLSPSLRTLESAYAALGRRLQLVAAPPPPPNRAAGPSGVDLSQIRRARRLVPAQRLDHLAAAARGVADLLGAVER
jgi:DNA-binding XRE family transcriptional regulator